MYLKSIEIHGFKSFANKIVFDFEDGITGIVGPNGSGKSNVADAVRWVLGEQKIKQLRGSKMEDVIFAGTANRKPLGYAFVSITLDNSDKKLKIDYNEVTVSRRIYRSGESEYMINGSVCRLRDIQELFYDTGIGKEGYSIIGQGQIDKILQGKPEDRRELFDEAAGIVKYKKRKTIALRKLENERLNLARIGDITKELSRQIGPLRKQSEAADKYVAYREELKNYDLNLFLIENGDINDKISQLKEKEAIASNDLEEENRSFEAMKEQYELLNENIKDLDIRIENTRNTIAQGQIVRETMSGQINLLKEQIRSLEDAESHYLERVNALVSEINRSESEKARMEEEKAENQTSLTSIITSASDQNSAVLDIQNQNEQYRLAVENAKSELMELIRAGGDINSQIERLGAITESIVQRREALNENLTRFSRDKDSQEKLIGELKSELEDIRGNIKEQQDQISELAKEAASVNKQISDAAREMEQAKEKQINCTSRLESVRNITERYEGYGNSIREVMKLKASNKGILGVVADIIRVEKKYEVAIETALGGSIQNVVTDTDTTAKDIIEYLKKNKFGRATFLPVKSIRQTGEFRNTDALYEKGIIGLASSLVDVDDKYRPVAEYLLGRIVVADTIDNALALARKYKYQLIIVTLEGELLNRGGSLTGGAFKNKSNLLGRRREIEELENEIQELKRIQEDIRKKTDILRQDRESFELKAEEANVKLHESQISLNTVQINLDQAINRQKEIDLGFEQASGESREIEQQEEKLSTESSTLKEKLDLNEDAIRKLQDRITEIEKESEELKNREAEELLKLQTLRTEQARLTDQNSFITSAIIKLESDIVRLQNDLDSLRQNSISSSGEKKKKEIEIADIEASLKLAETDEKEKLEQLYKFENEKRVRAGSHEDFLKRREASAQRIADLDKEVFRLTQNREKLEERFESRSNYIWEEYELTYTGALQFRIAELSDVREIRDHIALLKKNIRDLGTINVGAIEEYREVSERYEFLRKQYDDISKAEADLVKIIKDLDREMRRTFKTEFAKIQSEFSKVFREMFGGGHGSIELEEDVDVLDAGISIIAQPPGKKLQNIMQLSGGEKALTAIAVLFAIQNLKPSPFCILDEIEAALDDSNIGRFAGYLHKLSNEVQFIVITHRKGTMEAAHRLYGITMQEKGVSTLISVDLAEYHEDVS